MIDRFNLHGESQQVLIAHECIVLPLTILYAANSRQISKTKKRNIKSKNHSGGMINLAMFLRSREGVCTPLLQHK